MGVILNWPADFDPDQKFFLRISEPKSELKGELKSDLQAISSISTTLTNAPLQNFVCLSEQLNASPTEALVERGAGDSDPTIVINGSFSFCLTYKLTYLILKLDGLKAQWLY